MHNVQIEKIPERDKAASSLMARWIKWRTQSADGRSTVFSGVAVILAATWMTGCKRSGS